MVALVGIDLERDGKQHGHLAIPHSTHHSAYGQIKVPVTYLRNGYGPRALLSAGVHGDEFEGQITLSKLALELSSEDIKGSLLILPMANAPAVAASSRVSPLDQLNLNRVFPGNALARPTEAIAHAIETLLLARCDYAFDIHSGGTSLNYDAIGITASTGDKAGDNARLNLLNALDLDRGLLLSTNDEMGLDCSLDGAMLRQGVVGISAEFGGGGGLSPALQLQCAQSVQRFLTSIGLIPGSPDVSKVHQTKMYSVDCPEAYVFSSSSGIFVAETRIGQTVEKDDILGQIHDLLDLSLPPLTVRSELPGTVLCLRALPRVESGDCLVQIGRAIP